MTYDLYIADTENYRIQKFNSDGLYQSTIGPDPPAPSSNDNGHFRNPQGVAVYDKTDFTINTPTGINVSQGRHTSASIEVRSLNGFSGQIGPLYSYTSSGNHYTIQSTFVEHVARRNKIFYTHLIRWAIRCTWNLRCCSKWRYWHSISYKYNKSYSYISYTIL